MAWFTCMLGLWCMFLAFYATGMRGALSGGPLHPISTAGRIIFFLAGAAVFVDGYNRLSSGFGGPHVWWRGAIPFVVVGILGVALNAKRVRAYMRRIVTGKPSVAISFVGGFPAALVATRIAFIGVVAVMVVFGVAPVAFSTAKIGIIACVLALFALGLFYELLESHYVNTGRASVVNLTDDSAQR